VVQDSDLVRDDEAVAPQHPSLIPSSDLECDESLEMSQHEQSGFLQLRHSTVLTGEKARKVSNCCAICLASYATGNVVVWSSNAGCPHVFHEACLMDWLTHSQQDGTSCPCCRQSFLPDLEHFRKERSIRWAAERAFNPQAVSL
jgi:hypothetical protein